MYRMSLAFTLLVVGLLVAISAQAEDSFTFNFQGRLDGSDGNPVPDGNYQMMFFIYDDSVGGNLLWTETHPVVHTAGGFFGVDLGSANPCSLEIPALENIYLATQIGSLPPLSRRMKIATSPHAGVARRLYGDLQTSPGSLIIRDPEAAQSSISLHTGSENMGIVIEDRPTDPVNGRRFFGVLESDEMNLGFDGPNGQRLFSVSGRPGSLGKMEWGLFNPQPEPPGNEARLLLQASTNPSGKASMVMFNPQPEPPGSDPFKIIEMTNGVGSDAGIYMFNPQPEPPGNDPFFGLSATSNGPNMVMYSPQAGGAALVNNHPQIKLRSDSTASRFILQRAYYAGTASESTGMYMHADSIRSYLSVFENGNMASKIGTSSGGGYASFFSDGTQYMGVDPMPWNPGGTLKLYSSPGVEAISFSSTGAASFLGNGTEYMGIEPSPFLPGGGLKLFGAPGVASMSFSASGSASFLDDGSEYMGVDPSPWHAGGDINMYDAAGGQTLLLASNGMVSIGTGNHTNILTVKQYSSTDPIADAWTTYSSRRWKTNIQPLQGSLDKIMRLQGVSYDEKEGGKHNIGLIAEDVGKVVPEVVAYEDNGVDAKSVDYARLSALLIEAVKEQQKTIQSYKESNDKLTESVLNLQIRITELEKSIPK